MSTSARADDGTRISDAGYGWEAYADGADERLIRQCRMPAGGRLDAVGGPLVQRTKQCPHHLGMRHRVRQLLAGAAARRERGGTVLRSSNETDPDCIGRSDVARAVERGVGQRGGAPLSPVFNRAVRCEQSPPSSARAATSRRSEATG